MIVRTKSGTTGVEWGNGLSFRLLTQQDNMGFTVAHTVVRAGSKSPLHYRNHLEACYCIAGRGQVIDADGNTECQTGGSKTEGETCAPGDECGPGLGCVTGEDKKSTCRRWCRLGETDCGTGKTCTGFNPEIVVRGTAYGSCN